MGDRHLALNCNGYNGLLLSVSLAIVVVVRRCNDDDDDDKGY